MEPEVGERRQASEATQRIVIGVPGRVLERPGWVWDRFWGQPLSIGLKHGAPAAPLGGEPGRSPSSEANRRGAAPKSVKNPAWASEDPPWDATHDALSTFGLVTFSFESLGGSARCSLLRTQ